MALNRRDFIRVAGTATAGLSLAFPLTSFAREPRAESPLQPRAFLRIAPDGVVTVWVIRLEMGQGVRTLLPMLVAEDLEVSLESIRIEQAQPGGAFRDIELHTGGSESAPSTYMPLRIAGAAAREMLIAAAAAAWGVLPVSCEAKNGTVVHSATGRKRSYGSLANAASRLPVPVSPKLKDPSRFSILGKPAKRVDAPAIVTGRAAYGTDVVVPGMLYASIERAPVLGAKVVSVDSSDALKMDGVIDVKTVSSGLHPGVAVIARDSWSAMRGRSRLRITWSNSQFASFDSDEFLANQSRSLAGKLYKVRHVGDADAAIGSAAREIEATYTYPFQAHAPVETMNCTADVRADVVEIWVSTQTDVRTLDQAVKVSGLARDRVKVNCSLAGGGFGRRLFADYVAEAVELSKALRKPVQVLWTRSDDMKHGYFQPGTSQSYRAGVDAGGNVIAVIHRASSADLTVYEMHDGQDIWAHATRAAKEEGAFESPTAGLYEFPVFRIDVADVTSPIPTGPWRAVQAPAAVFARESFMDELARLSGKDPIELRIEMLSRSPRPSGPGLDRSRLIGVLEELKRRQTPTWAAAGDRLIGRGIAASVYAGTSYIAMMAEVSVARDLSDVRVRRMTTIVDCGMVLNPLGLDGQTESAIAWGLSATLHGKLDFRNGAAVQSSYGDFRVLRMDEMPELETVVLESEARPSGYGEHPVPLVAPAVANAVFDACGRRVRSLPITPESLVRAQGRG